MLLVTLGAACLASCVVAQLPPSYTQAHTNTTLGVTYGNTSIMPGSILDFQVPSQAPLLSNPIYLNSTYIVIAVDSAANLSAPIPAKLLWFQQDFEFSPAGLGSANTIAQVPYLAPTNVGHAYLVLLYAQPAAFKIPPDFPYTDSFRSGFNVSRVAVDFKTPLLEANWFILGSDCTEVDTTPTGHLPSGTGLPNGTAVYQGMKSLYPGSNLHLRI